MSPRATRERTSRAMAGRAGRRGLRRGVELAAWLLAGALAGSAAAWGVGGRFVPGALPDRATWNVVTPGLDERVVAPELGRGVLVAEGALLLRPHVFYRADILSPRDTRDAGRMVVDLAPGSGPLRVVLRGYASSPPLFLQLGPDSWSLGGSGNTSAPKAGTSPWELRLAAEGASLVAPEGAIPLGKHRPGPIELTAESEEVRVRSIRVEDARGAVILAEDYAGARPGAGLLAVGALLGTLLSAGVRSIVRGGTSHTEGAFAAAFVGLPAVLVACVPSSAWLASVERLYLVRTPAWDLAKLALGGACLPLAALALLRSGLLAPRDPLAAGAPAQGWRKVPAAAWRWGGAVTCAILGARTAEGWEWLGVLPGAWLLAWPGKLTETVGEDPHHAWRRDLPGQLAVALLGWPLGLGPLLLWRLTWMAAGVRRLLDRDARSGALQLFGTLLLLPVAAELAVRGTYLQDGWDAERLAGEGSGEAGWRDPEPFWKAGCGPEDGARQTGVIFAGGSSTGGAYQFRNEPTAFFAARAHGRLCERRPEGVRLQVSNFGDGGRDSHTVNRSLENLLRRGAPAEVLVLYTGVNDVMTHNNTLTRKQREARASERQAALRGLSGLAMRSRLVTGLGLLGRPLHGVGGQTVADVPLPDAEENIRAIAKLTEERGMKLLLVTELVATEMAGQLQDYEAMEERLAGELPGVRWVDLRKGLGQVADSELLVDRNHLSRAGAERVAEVLTPVIAEALGFSEAADPGAAPEHPLAPETAGQGASGTPGGGP